VNKLRLRELLVGVVGDSVLERTIDSLIQNSFFEEDLLGGDFTSEELKSYSVVGRMAIQVTKQFGKFPVASGLFSYSVVLCGSVVCGFVCFVWVLVLVSHTAFVQTYQTN